MARLTENSGASGSDPKGTVPSSGDPCGLCLVDPVGLNYKAADKRSQEIEGKPLLI